MERAMTVHELRSVVTARDKAVCSSRPTPEGSKFIRERYSTDMNSAKAFVEYVKGVTSNQDSSAIEVANPSEVWHLRFDENKGEWIKLDERQRLK
jgi:hypothetical protein